MANDLRPVASRRTTSQSGPRPRNNRGEGGRLKGEVIEAALRLLDRSPSAELSLRMVAKEAGVAAPSIYSHFPDAKAVMTEIVRQCWVQMGDEMSRAAAECLSDEVREIIKAQMAAYVRYAMERPSRYQLLFAMQPIEEHEPNLGLLLPAYRSLFLSIERWTNEGGALPANGVLSSTLLTLSIAHGRIAFARLAPLRVGNSAPEVATFVAEALDRLFPD